LEGRNRLIKEGKRGLERGALKKFLPSNPQKPLKKRKFYHFHHGFALDPEELWYNIFNSKALRARPLQKELL
jgi:hypothetical protein